MEMKIGSDCMHWSQSHGLASSILSTSKTRKALFCTTLCSFVDKSARLRRTSTGLSLGGGGGGGGGRRTLRRAFSEHLGGFSDEEFDIDNIRELARRLLSEEEPKSENSFNSRNTHAESSSGYDFDLPSVFSSSKVGISELPWMRTRPEPPYEILPALKYQFSEAGATAACSVKKAFSSMVFIVRELHSYTLQMRELVFLEDVHGILDRVQCEMHASFVWLFQQIFSHTPTLMMYVMILMANFTVHSMSSNAAIAANPPVQYHSTTAETEIVSLLDQNHLNPKFDSTSGKAISIGGGNDGGGKVNAIGSGTDGGDEERYMGVSSIHHDDTLIKKEVQLWNSFVDEASEMRAELMDESLDQETMQQFVSPIIAEVEPEDYTNYSRTDLKYQEAISQEPYNPLLLTNYAQFLYIVFHDHDRAEEYFKRASKIKPVDAETLNKYATFLWLAKKDTDMAEETFLEAIEADPGNADHQANYAHFLWNTGAPDTCYPL